MPLPFADARPGCFATCCAPWSARPRRTRRSPGPGASRRSAACSARTASRPDRSRLHRIAHGVEVVLMPRDLVLEPLFFELVALVPCEVLLGDEQLVARLQLRARRGGAFREVHALQ